ncbi:MAG: aspartate aminotransferase family protein [Chloroflexi bacterium]|nr:aspartate aminotransferase family protein [Chloroflexota bacterium]MCL5108803.1 aspartate aminotransferase family protein [Chloroflexota bacterium]
MDYDTEQLRQADLAHVLHGNTNLYDYVRGAGPIVLVKGNGAVVTDSDGKEYIDGLAGLWNVNIGHGRTEIADAVAQQVNAVGYVPTMLNLANVPSINLAAKLAQITPEGINRFYFACGGAEANETAFKSVRYFHSVQGRKDRVKIISRHMAYHGVAVNTMAATGLPQFWQNFGPPAPYIVHIPAPYCYRCAYGKTYGQCELDCATALEGAIQAEGEDSVAAFIGEPVQGAGGVIVPPKEYWPIVRDICSRYGVLLIADEVITGFGRTGTYFGVEHWHIKPDLMSMAKGITSAYQPLAAVGFADKVFDGMAQPGAAYMHNYTYSGHPVVCAAALKNIEILERENLVQRSAEMGRYLNERLAELRDYPFVGETRGLGLIAAIEFVADKKTKAKFQPQQKFGAQLTKLTRERGLLSRAGDEYLALSPPLVIGKEQIDSAVDTIKAALTSIQV